MKALSVQQPWAWLLTNIDPSTGQAWKPVENRSWRTLQRGEVLIHAGKKFDHEGYFWVQDEFPEIPLPAPEEFQRGGIVGKVTIVDCVSKMDSPWFFGEFGFLMTDAKPLPFFPYRGELGFFEVEVPL